MAARARRSAPGTPAATSTTPAADVADSAKALSEMLIVAARKRRTLTELAELRRQKLQGFTLAAIGVGLVTAVCGIIALVASEPSPFIAGAILLCGLAGAVLSAVAVIIEPEEPGIGIEPDLARAGTLLRQMRELRRGDAHATPLGRTVLVSLSEEFKEICDAHMPNDPAAFAIFNLDGAVDKTKSRGYAQITPRQTIVELKLETGQKRQARIKSVSQVGTIVSTDMQLPAGTRVTLGSTPARVLRPTEDGLSLQFLTPFPVKALVPEMTL